MYYLLWHLAAPNISKTSIMFMTLSVVSKIKFFFKTKLNNTRHNEGLVNCSKALPLSRPKVMKSMNDGEISIARFFRFHLLLCTISKAFKEHFNAKITV